VLSRDDAHRVGIAEQLAERARLAALVPEELAVDTPWLSKTLSAQIKLK
jgi:hypothetical protein